MTKATRIVFANSAVTIFNLLITILMPLGIYRLSQGAFLSLLFGGSLAVWLIIFSVVSALDREAR